MEQKLLEKITPPQLDQNYPPSLSLVIHNGPSFVHVQNRTNKIHILKLFYLIRFNIILQLEMLQTS
jgi:hypothetical protein